MLKNLDTKNNGYKTIKETKLDMGLCVMMCDGIKILRFEKKIGKNRKKIGKK